MTDRNFSLKILANTRSFCCSFEKGMATASRIDISVTTVFLELRDWATWKQPQQNSKKYYRSRKVKPRCLRDVSFRVIFRKDVPFYPKEISVLYQQDAKKYVRWQGLLKSTHPGGEEARERKHIWLKGRWMSQGKTKGTRTAITTYKPDERQTQNWHFE